MRAWRPAGAGEGADDEAWASWPGNGAGGGVSPGVAGSGTGGHTLDLGLPMGGPLAENRIERAHHGRRDPVVAAVSSIQLNNGYYSS